MIKNKNDYKNFLYHDKIALGIEYKHPKIIGDEIWKFERKLRKTEYYFNCRKDFIGKLLYMYNMFKYHKMRVKLGISIPLNVFDSGLAIVHFGTITVNNNTIVGKNCRIQESTTIGATNGKLNAATIGNNVFIGSGARIIGDITIADDIAIGANAVVNKDFLEPGITIAGVPAKKISNNNSHSNLCKKIFENKNSFSSEEKDGNK